MNDSRQSINSNIEVTGHKPGERPDTDGNDKEDLTPENPYNELGFGFTAYFGMLRTFICYISDPVAFLREYFLQTFLSDRISSTPK